MSGKYGRVVKSWIFHIHALFVSDAKYIQAILSHPTEIKKNRMYSLLNQWLGDGLLTTSNQPKWRSRRRAITPAFHFQILDNFIHVFDQQASVCVKKISHHAQKYAFDIEHYIGLATLDVICETAMGVKINAQTHEHCEYVRNLIEMQNIFTERFVKIAYRSEVMFRIFQPNLYAKYQSVMKNLHSFTETIIRERRQSKIDEMDTATGNAISEGVSNVFYGKKKSMALLDILLSAKVDGRPLSDKDIREEVDTFMFEGHDTTKSGLGFTLYAISRNEDDQQKLNEELIRVIGSNVDEPLTYNKLTNLHYMDKVIKESLRMYPPVPFIGRQTIADLYIDNQLIPKGTNILIGIMTMQNDPEYFTDPQRFMPDRGMPENNFVFVPFSAGPRNCIGQRFAMLEIKAFLTRIIQSFELLPLGECVEPTISIVLKSKKRLADGIQKKTLSNIHVRHQSMYQFSKITNKEHILKLLSNSVLNVHFRR
ncbi:cytochrome P450 4d2-like [Musca vetustissima]|uniref:cytochrome P450 4d2-like n=1 Tax=Musca vetustissima TaxID=27455 RepID=UPI002AB67EC9|nr:cytochrome P450 4d2-like [Musca vetustissima]